MSKKSRIPKISEQEADELAQACRFAFGNETADEFLDQVLAEARWLRKRRIARGERTRTEQPPLSPL